MYPNIDQIRSMPTSDVKALNRDLAKKLLLHTTALVWLKVTIPAVTVVCVKHAAKKFAG